MKQIEQIREKIKKDTGLSKFAQLIGLPERSQDQSILTVLIEQIKLYFTTITRSPWLIDKDFLMDQSKTTYFENVLMMLKKILTPLKIDEDETTKPVSNLVDEICGLSIAPEWCPKSNK